jgi:hypothetical protein
MDAVDRHIKTVSFAPYVVQFAKRILLPSKEGLDALTVDYHEENVSCGLQPETLRAMHAALALGKDLDCTTQNILKDVSRLLNSVGTISKNESFDLFSWVKRVISRASTDAIYGTS